MRGPGAVFKKSILVPLMAGALIHAVPVQAGEEPLYQPAPAWVIPADLGKVDVKQGPPVILAEVQQRLEDGKLYDYRDVAYRLDSPEAMTSAGTLTATWFPDKGDLIVHKVQIIRGDKVIDVLAGGAKFEVLRREEQLEQRLISGALTASLAVPGLQLGDVLRMTYSTVQSDQALGREVQTLEPLPAKPAPMQGGQVRISWPADEEVHWKVVNGGEDPALATADGYTTLTFDLPLAEPQEMPRDAPARYRLPPLVQATTFADWQEISRLMAVHFGTKDTIKPDGALMGEVKTIEQASDDQLTRAALALRLVQDKVSYLLNGLDGGNYLPQSPEDTWKARFGDCKAKSLLLLAMLREMGIDAEAVLIRSSGGDALPSLLPMPADFDHVIVRAVIGGKEYWLDGTAAGTRMANIADVPAFSYGLPLRPDGATLIPLTPRPKEQPDRMASFTIDQSAGVDLPALFTAEVRLSGILGATTRQVQQMGNDDYIKTFAGSMMDTMLGNNQLASWKVSYDEDSGIATVEATGLLDTLWQFDHGRASEDVPALPANNYKFTADRAKLAWRDIPVAIRGNDDFLTKLTVILPDGGDGFELRGKSDIDTAIAGAHITRSAKLDGGKLEVTEQAALVPTEVAPADISAEKGKSARFAAASLSVRAPAKVTRRWDYGTPEARKRLAPIDKVYDQLIADEPDKAAPYTSRAWYRRSILDWNGALADIEKAIAIEPSAQRLFIRANILNQLGRDGDALKSIRAAFDLDPTPQNAMAEALGMAELGKYDDALDLISQYEDSADDQTSVAATKAQVLGMAGRGEEGLDLLNEQLAERPGDPELLNDICWHMGTWQVGQDEMLARCTKAVESAEWSPPVLDSRAMAYFRLGKLDEALADLNAALSAQPDQVPTMYLRGIVKSRMGNTKDGQAEIATALRIAPELAKQYARYGIMPPKQ